VQAFGAVTEPLQVASDIIEQRDFMEPGLGRTVIQEGSEWVPGYVSGIAPKAQQAYQGLANVTKAGIKRWTRQGAPAIDEIRGRADSIYKQIDQMDATVDPQHVASLYDDIYSDLRLQGIDPDLTPKAWTALQRIKEAAEGGRPITVSELEILRRKAGIARQSVEAPETMLGGMIQQNIDNFILGLGDDVVSGIDGKAAHGMLKEARALWSQRKKADKVENMIEVARTYASGFENGMRNQARNLRRAIADNKEKGWTDAEIEMIEKIYKGGRIDNLLKFMGKFGIEEGGALRVLIPGFGSAAGAGIASAAGLPPAAGAVAVPIVGQAARNAAGGRTLVNAETLSEVARAGKNGRRIVAAYLSNTPKSERSAEVLARLLLEQRVPKAQLEALRASQTVLASNASIFATAMMTAQPITDAATEYMQ